MSFTPIDLLGELEYYLAPGCDASMLHSLNVKELCRDSRTASGNSIFICIKGASFDGHDYAQAAFQSGCRAFVVQHPLSLPECALQIIVPDSRVALASLSDLFFGRPSKELTIIGITGTKGKTTTALTAYRLLNDLGFRAGYIGSNGVEFGETFLPTVNTTPESYDLHRYMRLMADSGVKYLVMEVSSQAIYMNRIYGIDFDAAVYTNLAPDHIGGSEHPTFEHYRDSKKRLFSEFGAKKIIYNADDPHSGYMISGSSATAISCSLESPGDVCAVATQRIADKGCVGSEFYIRYGGHLYPTAVKSPGLFSVHNAILAAAICISVGAEIKDVARLLPTVSVKGRFESVDVLQGVAIMIDYAHNGVSLRSALTALREYTEGRLICLFGSVGGRTKGRRRELGDAAAELADLSIITSDNPDFEPPEDIISDIEQSFILRGKLKGTDYVTFTDRREAIFYAVEEARPGDVILLAGKGHEDSQLICGNDIPFSERAIVTEASRRMKDPV